jgi:UDP-N-acetylglucosamine 2-epimerase
MKVATIVGARPQFIKAAAISPELRKRHAEFLVHTGQHYDYEMSGIFFDGLDIPAPDVNLGVGSGPHGAQTGAMLEGIEEILLAERPDWLLIYGDTNSTLAGALAAAKVHVPVAHVEAGLRSFNRQMPEEINRVVADHLSDLLLCPSQIAIDNLAREGLRSKAHLVGDVMLDVLNLAVKRADTHGTQLLQKRSVSPGSYLLLTLHRSENTDAPERLAAILQAINRIEEPVLFPVHPRARKAISTVQPAPGSHVRMIDPVGYFEMVTLARAARLVLTDSGGLQKEAYWLGVPCVTLRNETEWLETVEAGWNTLVGADPDRISAAVRSFAPPAARPGLYGDGHAATRCAELLH